MSDELPFDQPVDEFNIEKARAARDEGIERVDAHAAPDFKRAAFQAATAVAQRVEEFSTDEVWKELGNDAPSTHERRAMGPVMLRVASEGVAEPMAVYIQSERVACHGRMVRLWRSKIRS